MYGAKPLPLHLYNFTTWFFVVQRGNSYYVYVFELKILISQQPYRTQVRGKECMEQYHSPCLLPMQLQGMVLNHAERETFIMYTYLILGFSLIS